jgi:ATP-binding cassette, subfamily F, member 3
LGHAFTYILFSYIKYFWLSRRNWIVLAGFEGVTKRYGEQEVLKGVDWQVHEAEHWALVGPNGCGKTTLLKILAGGIEHDNGTLTRARSLRVATVPQVDLAGLDTSARDYLRSAFSHILEVEDEVAALHHAMSEGDHSPETLARLSDLQDWLHHHGGYTYEVDLERALAGLGFTPQDGDRPCGSFSGGEQMRLKLGRAILDPADLLLLDEPGNHLDDTQRAWLGKFLTECPRAFAVVTHDPEILEGAVDHVAFLIDGKLHTFRGDFAAFEVQFEEMQKSRERAYEQQQAYIQRTQEFIRRYKAGQRSKQARGREKVLARLERVEAPLRLPDGFELRLKFDQVTGEDVLQVRDLRLSLGDREIAAPKLDLQRGWKVALLGANGSGKTTLLRALCGEVPPISGTVRWGTNVRLAHYDQHQRRLPHGETIFRSIADLVPEFTREDVMRHLGAFGFGGTRAEQGVGSLSGGERARLHLLGVLLAKANVLFLDEPTNHLDKEAVEMIRVALARYKGTVILVSHDEEFARSVTTHTWAVAGGAVRFSAGYEPGLAVEVEPVAPKRSAPAQSAPAREKPARPGLSKNERYRIACRMEEAEKAVADLTAERDRIEGIFANPDSVVTHDWRALQDRYEALKVDLARAEQAWLEASSALEQD